MSAPERCPVCGSTNMLATISGMYVCTDCVPGPMNVFKRLAQALNEQEEDRVRRELDEKRESQACAPEECTSEACSLEDMIYDTLGYYPKERAR